MNTQSATEAMLASAYAEEATLYASALQSAEKLLVGLEQGGTGDAELLEVVARLNQVHEIENRIAGAKSTWKESDARPGPELSKTLVQVAELIQKLMSCLQGAEHHAGSRQRSMIKDLENLVRGQNMKRAYETALAFAVTDDS